MSTPVTPKDFSEIRWRGHWIWTELPAMLGSPFAGMGGADERAEAHGLFRKSFGLERVPERAPARITADSRYVLFVNGQEAFRGPVRSQPRRMHYDLLDLAPYLKAGENVVAVYVKYYGAANSYWIPAVANATLGKSGVLVFEAKVFAADLGEGGWLVSDGSWKATKSDAWSEPPAAEGPVGGGIPVEIFDAARFPYGWEQPGFDDAAWGNAVPILGCTSVALRAPSRPQTPTARSIRVPSPGSAARPVCLRRSRSRACRPRSTSPTPAR
jgi:alpha-L-rhamnosidase